MTAKITLLQDDISALAVEAIVSPVDRQFQGDDGKNLNGQIYRAGGDVLLDAFKLLGSFAVGEAKITEGFNLPAKWVIHTLGPQWQGGKRGEAQQLASCYRAALALARQVGIRTIAFPAICSGASGFPLAQAGHIGVNTVIEALAEQSNIRKVIFCVAEPLEHQSILRALGQSQLH